MKSIAANIADITQRLPEGVELVAVSKFHPASSILEAYNAGQRIFGESRVQEIRAKATTLPPDIKWHFIGHLQTNKVKQLIGIPAMIESVDSEKLLRLINQASEKAGVVTNVLLQAHVAMEETKFGFYPDEMLKLLDAFDPDEYTSIRICGLMGMASNTDDATKIEADFDTLHNLFTTIANKYGDRLPHFHKLSMGMSHDWPIAIGKGANLVRVGTAIFGERDYGIQPLS